MRFASMYLALKARTYRLFGWSEMRDYPYESYGYERGRLLVAYGNFLKSLAEVIK